MFTISIYLILPESEPLPLPRAGSRLKEGALKGPSSLGAALWVALRTQETDKTPCRSDNRCIILAQLARIRIFIAVAWLVALVPIPPLFCIITPKADGRADGRADRQIG